MESAAKFISPLERPSYPTLDRVKVGNDFLGTWLNKIQTVTAKDVLTKFNAEGALSNYERVIAGEKGGHVGPPWYHGLINECIRGISDILVSRYDAELDATLDSMIALMEKAQVADPENYINPYTMLMCPDQRWGKNGGSLIFQHETYNAGCLAEAGVHHYRATGKTSLLTVAVKMVNYLADFIGDAPKHNVVCEHSLPEEAFLKMYNLFREDEELKNRLGAHPEEYLRLVRYFIHHKGDNETRYSRPQYMREYAQDHRYAKEQREAVGHAVRAVLFYTGIAALALEDGDKELAITAEAIWNDIVQTKLHISGGVGVNKAFESFGAQYELPHDAYLETCAGVGLVFFGNEMFKLLGDASIWETIEATVYNLLPASVSADGTKYTYVNPLVTNETQTRWEWHGCPCCPPMLLKLAGSLPSMIFAERGSDVWLNLHVNSTLQRENMTLTLEDRTLTVRTVAGSMPLTLHIRIPSWAKDFRLSCNGKPLSFQTEQGYAVISGGFSDGDRIELHYRVAVEKYISHPYAKANAGRVAIKYGPFLYCAESLDQVACETPEDLDFEIDDIHPLELQSDGSIVGVRTTGEPFRLIPYHFWNNRTPCCMRVWFKQQGLTSDPMDTVGWDHKLYRVWKEYL